MKIAFITGVSSGIGHACLGHLHSVGYHVIGTVRKEEDKKRLMSSYPERCDILVADVRDDVVMNDAISSIQKLLEVHGLSMLINNAGIAVPGPIQYISPENFEMQLDVNVKSVHRITNRLLPYLGTNPKYKPGKIVNISSVSGLFTSPFTGVYSVSKYALEAMSDAYRRELDMFGIKVALIEPGPIKTEIWQKNVGALDPYKDTEYGKFIAFADKMIEKSEQSAMPVEAITKVLARIDITDRPRARYLVQKKPWMFKALVHLIPTSWVDNLIRKGLAKGDKRRPF
jgi:NAD(P)-dependent dehydrogenase (short-subunit alcohol dehydrogenase family)